MSMNSADTPDTKEYPAKTKNLALAMGNDEETNAAMEQIEDSAEIYFPDGGAKAWLTVLGGWLSFIAGIGLLSGFSVIQSYYSTTELPTRSADDISWIGSVQLWGCFAFGILSGRVSDKYGPKVPLALGSVFMVLGTMMASISKRYYQFMLSQGVCSAIGLGLAFTPALAIQSQWFLKKRGFVVGLVMSGQNVGGVIWPILINRLINVNGVSWGWTLRIIGFIQLVLMVLAIFLVHPRFPPGTIRDHIRAKEFFTDIRTSLFTLSTFMIFLGIYIPYFYLTSYGMQRGASAEIAFYYTAILNGGAFFGCYALGAVVDLGLGAFNSLTAVAFGTAVTAFGWIGARNNASVIGWSVVYGFLSGALQALFSPCLSSLAPTPELIGTWNGLGIAIISFAVLGTGPIAGRLLENANDTNYVPMQVFTGVTLMVGSVLYLITRLLVSRQAIL